jgi:hypothetical protein
VYVSLERQQILLIRNPAGEASHFACHNLSRATGPRSATTTRKTLCVTCVLAAVLMAMVSTGRADPIIQNGSFETSSIAGSFNYTALSPGLTSELPNWTVASAERQGGAAGLLQQNSRDCAAEGRAAHKLEGRWPWDDCLALGFGPRLHRQAGINGTSVFPRMSSR